MAKENELTSNLEGAPHFWEALSDHTQAAVHLALQWLAYVYPASELQIDRVLKDALPYADPDLSNRWAQFLDEHDVEEHVEALTWMAEVISSEQIPFLVETCWRLVLSDHELPTHVPLALRIMGQILGITEQRLHEIGGEVFRELIEVDEEKSRAPLLPVDPRYLDRIEWRLYGHTATSRNIFTAPDVKKSESTGKFPSFVFGFFSGACVVAFLVFGPLQLGRITVSRMQHENTPEIALTPAPMIPDVELDQPISVAEPEPESQPTPITSENATEVEPIIEDVLVEAPTAEASITSPAVNRVLMSITANVLNVRTEATVDSDIVAKLGKGAKVWAYPDEANGLWMKIKFDDKAGFASARFMTETD